MDTKTKSALSALDADIVAAARCVSRILQSSRGNADAIMASSAVESASAHLADLHDHLSTPHKPTRSPGVPAGQGPPASRRASSPRRASAANLPNDQ